MRVRKVIQKDGTNAAVSINVNEPGSVSAVASSQDVEAEDVKDETGTELPDREGTYDELREEATKDVDEGTATEGEQDG